MALPKKVSYLVGGTYNTDLIVLNDGDLSPFQVDVNGNLKVAFSGTIQGGNPAAGPTGAPVPADADYLGVNVGGTLDGVTGFAVGSSVGVAVAIIDGAGNQITSFGGGTQYADGTTQVTPTGTVALGKNPSNVLHALALDASGNLLVDVSNASLSVTQGTSPWVVSGAISFTAPQHVIVDSGSVSISGTVGVTQSTNPWTVQDLADVPAGGGTTAPSQVMMVGGKTVNSSAAGIFTHVQGAETRTASPVSSVSVVLGSNPTTGNLVCVAIAADNSGSNSLVSVIDSNGNVYTITPSSPANQTTEPNVWLAYLLIAPSNASKTITATFAVTVSTGHPSMWADEFSHTGTGVVVFDKDVAGGGTGSAVNFPTIIPANSGSLTYAAATVQSAVASATSPWILGIIDAGGHANEYGLSISSPLEIGFSLTPAGSWSWNAMGAAFFLGTNPAVFNYDILPLGISGRSVIVEGATGSNVVPIQTIIQTNASVNLSQISSSMVVTSSPGVLEVGIVGGTAGSFIDGVITAATAPPNGLVTLVVNKTTAPSLTTGQSVAAQADYVGSLFVKPYRRSQTVSQATTIASSSAVTTILAAQAAGIFSDLTNLIITTTPAATTAIQFTATLSDGTNSFIFDLDTGATAASGVEGNLFLIFNPPLKATTAATVWTLKLSVATVTVHVTVNAILQKAS